MGLLVECGGKSASAEAGGGNAVAANGGMAGMAGNAVNPGVMNGLVLNGQPFLAQLVPVGGSLQQQPIMGQAGMLQLVPVGALQQGGALPVGQTGAANAVPPQPGQNPQLANGALQLLVLPPANGNGGVPMLMQIVPVGGGNNVQQPAVAGKIRVKHSVRFYGIPTSTTNPPLVTAEDVEDSSGSDPSVQYMLK
ncbi:hypothetical protein UPYG_G00041340 [Umbra pygmaea]|uniref:Uncharacterized protein n=1 Tax=Umbra pygmaea TaxID=75934 RepID=A0ABD0YE51_UMBPY